MLVCWACVYTWTWSSLVKKAVVWLGPSCWFRGSDLRTPTQSRQLETEGNVSVTQHFRDTCRVSQGLDAESQVQGLPPSPSPTPFPSHCTQLSLPPTLPLSPSLPSPYSLPSPPPTPTTHSAPPTLHLQTFPPFHSPVSCSPSLCCSWHREGVLLGGLLEGWDQKTEEPDPKHLCGARGFSLVSMECSLFGTLLVTAMQELLEASSKVSLFGGGPASQRSSSRVCPQSCW